MRLSFDQAIIGGLVFILLFMLYKCIKQTTFSESTVRVPTVKVPTVRVPTVRVPTVKVPTVRDSNADNYIKIKYNQEKQWRAEAFGENCDMDILCLFYNKTFL